jgi:hypothetical protein
MNFGFNNVAELTIMAQAWRNLYEYVRPDLIIFDHSPTALLAARGCKAKKALIGTGFFCPLDQYPLADLRPWLGKDDQRLKQTEDQVCDTVNQVLKSFGQQPLDRLAQLFHEVDENFLVTFAELDHYGARPGARYWGAWTISGGKKPIWPNGQGKRIYAYLKPFPGLPQLLALLNDLQCPTILLGDGLDEKMLGQFASSTMRFERRATYFLADGRWVICTASRFGPRAKPIQPSSMTN